ncbi:MAG: hypothetical protein WBB39_02765 [Candidatus Saccharimonadales bacterium]
MKHGHDIDFTPLDTATSFSRSVVTLLPAFLVHRLAANRISYMQWLMTGWIIILGISIPLGLSGLLSQMFDTKTYGYLVVFLFVCNMTVGQWLMWALATHNDQRLAKFASSNSLYLGNNLASGDSVGMMLQAGKKKDVNSIVTISNKTAPDVMIGSRTIETGSGRFASYWDIGFIVMRLPRKLPHIVLDARRNNRFHRLTNLTDQFKKHQMLELEGNFGQYFTVFCPAGKERDALYLFTPDVMQSAIDNLQGECDIEIVEDRLYIYQNQPFTVDAKSYKKIYESSLAIFEQIKHQAEKYSPQTVSSQSLSRVSRQCQPDGLLQKAMHWTQWWRICAWLFIISSLMIMVWAFIDTSYPGKFDALFNVASIGIYVGGIGVFVGGWILRYRAE